MERWRVMGREVKSDGWRGGLRGGEVESDGWRGGEMGSDG